MGHPTGLPHILWDGLRSIYRDIRRAVASAEEHSGEALVVQTTVDEVMAALGRHSFAPNWEFSYYERGENMNLAQIVYNPREVQNHTFRWWQTHVRGWSQDDGSVRLRAHYELEPTEYDHDHINGLGIDVSAGIENTANALDEEGLSYEHYEQLPAGGEQ